MTHPSSRFAMFVSVCAPVIGDITDAMCLTIWMSSNDCNLVEICTRKITLFKGNCIVRTHKSLLLHSN